MNKAKRDALRALGPEVMCAFAEDLSLVTELLDGADRLERESAGLKASLEAYHSTESEIHRSYLDAHKRAFQLEAVVKAARRVRVKESDGREVERARALEEALDAVADFDQTPEEARAELEADGVDVLAFTNRVNNGVYVIKLEREVEALRRAVAPREGVCIRCGMYDDGIAQHEPDCLIGIALALRVEGA